MRVWRGEGANESVVLVPPRVAPPVIDLPKLEEAIVGPGAPVANPVEKPPVCARELDIVLRLELTQGRLGNGRICPELVGFSAEYFGFDGRAPQRLEVVPDRPPYSLHATAPTNR